MPEGQYRLFGVNCTPRVLNVSGLVAGEPGSEVAATPEVQISPQERLVTGRNVLDRHLDQAPRLALAEPV